ncbi:MAG: subclass B1 metallo-beta-lactamase [Chitinophagaceae bacterium]
MKFNMVKLILITTMLAGYLLISCKGSSSKQSPANQKSDTLKDTSLNNDTIVYQTDNLIIRRLSEHVYQHISFLNTKDFGRVSCNGMVVVNQNEAVVFDTPADNVSAGELIKFADKIKARIKAVIPTHFHEDCVGSLEIFSEHNIPGYASGQTIELLKNKNNRFAKELVGFNDSLTMDVGNKKVYTSYFGEGHTKDNIIGYFPDDKAVFGGCLIKEVGAKKGNLEDANIGAWPGTVSKLKQKYPGVQIVIPGHGKPGGTELYDYTIKLFK